MSKVLNKKANSLDIQFHYKPLQTLNREYFADRVEVSLIATAGYRRVNCFDVSCGLCPLKEYNCGLRYASLQKFVKRYFPEAVEDYPELFI